MDTAEGLEKALLKGYLHAQREHVLSAVVGLDDEGIRAGHLDAARELFDGKQWLVLTD